MPTPYQLRVQLQRVLRDWHKGNLDPRGVVEMMREELELTASAYYEAGAEIFEDELEEEALTREATLERENQDPLLRGARDLYLSLLDRAEEPDESATS